MGRVAGQRREWRPGDKGRARQDGGRAGARTRNKRKVSSNNDLLRGGGHQRRGGGRGDVNDGDDAMQRKISKEKENDSHSEDVSQDAPQPLLAVPERGHVPVGTMRKLRLGPTYMSLQIPRVCGLITYNK